MRRAKESQAGQCSLDPVSCHSPRSRGGGGRLPLCWCVWRLSQRVDDRLDLGNDFDGVGIVVKLAAESPPREQRWLKSLRLMPPAARRLVMSDSSRRKATTCQPFGHNRRLTAGLLSPGTLRDRKST